MPIVEYAPAALQDLQQIREYVASRWGESVANRVLRNITTHIRMLEQFPAMGIDLGIKIDVPTAYRCLFVEKNGIFYRLEEDKIRIVRVLGEKQAFLHHLFGIPPDTGEDE